MIVDSHLLVMTLQRAVIPHLQKLLHESKVHG